MDGKGKVKKWILVGVGAGILVTALGGVWIRMMWGPENVSRVSATPVTSAQGYLAANDPNALPTVQGGTRTGIISDIPTPNAGAGSASSGVAIPVKMMDTGSVSFRQFDVSGVGGKFSPDTIVVDEGDVIDLTLTATDGAYGIYFPDFAVSLAASEGKTAHAQFQATNYGQYRFYCDGSCVGDPKGTLIVNKKQ
jgi:heme/copper-type cytochrome/quinol oxidase subunit 2